jgi:carboxypeptidase family protein
MLFGFQFLPGSSFTRKYNARDVHLTSSIGGLLHDLSLRRVICLVDPLASRLKLCLAILLVLQGCLVRAQIAAPSDKPEPGAIEGTVYSNATGQPLRRAQVVLRAADTGNGGRFQTTDDNGKFSFPTVAPGRYSITVQRDGFLKLSAGRVGSYKMPPVFFVRSGEKIRGLDFKMVPAGVVSGKVKFDDAEPAVNVAVQLYREYYDRGRHGYLVAASGFTNDRGEYRLAGLEQGAYYVAALYQGPAQPPDADEQVRTGDSGKRPQDLSYAVTFFPEVQKMADAVAVHVGPGEEVGGMDIFLTLVHTARIHGRVSSALSGKTIAGPSLALRWNDPDNTGSVSAPVNVSYDQDQNFEIKGVTPGPYLLITTGNDDGKSLSARTPISVGDEDIADLDIVIGPEKEWQGAVRMEGDEPAATGLLVMLEPRRPTAFPNRSQLGRNGEFSVTVSPNETYDLYVLNAPDDAYLKSIQVGNSDRLASGLEAGPGDAPSKLDVVLSTRGGQVSGEAVTANDPSIVATGAAIMLIPDPPEGRVQTYKTAFADEYGSFLMRGVAPGDYLLVAWMDQPPCQIYNPDDLAACRAVGVRVTIAEGGGESVQVTAN